MDKRFRVLRQELVERPTSSELRGWSYEAPPTKPISTSLRFGVGELASRYCETLRDIYLRRILGVKPPPSFKMARGIAFHEVMKAALFDIKRFIYKDLSSGGKGLLASLLPRSESIGLDAVERAEAALGSRLGEEDRRLVASGCSNLYEFLVIQGAAALDRTLSKYPHAEPDSVVNAVVPLVSERKVDGSLVGLSSGASTKIPAGDFKNWVELGGVALSGYPDSIRTIRVYEHPTTNKWVVGFVGEVHFSLPKDLYSEKYAKVVDVLLRFGEYTNVGGGRSAGLGVIKYLSADQD